MKKTILIFYIFSVYFLAFSQENFHYEIQLEAMQIPNLPGFHSFAFGEYNGEWFIVGGRLDGLHARQPFAAFPAAQNNTNLYVVDANNQSFYTKSLTDLSTDLQEQLQATNTCFYQDGNTLFIMGGYAFSASNNDHITFPFLTAVDIPGVVDAIKNNVSIAPFFKQIEDQRFAITGGYLGKINNMFYLVGGHRFDGRYNPMNGPTFTQTYSNKIQKFTIDNSGVQLSIGNYSFEENQVHLHRRDYNLLPQIFPDGTEGYTISSGVFQINADLPYLYAVDIDENGFTARTEFNQYLSNYHSAKLALHDEENHEMFNILFGGMSQYYYDNGQLIQDDNVPFVKTISMLNRTVDNNLHEYKLPIEMPEIAGASAEFIPNLNLPYTAHEVLELNNLISDTVLAGYIVGGINSSLLNPFTQNQTNSTSAANTIYKVFLINTDSSGTPTALEEVKVSQAVYDFSINPNPAKNKTILRFSLDKLVGVDYFITDMHGKIVEQKELFVNRGENEIEINIGNLSDSVYLLTLSFDNKYYLSKKLKIK